MTLALVTLPAPPLLLPATAAAASLLQLGQVAAWRRAAVNAAALLAGPPSTSQPQRARIAGVCTERNTNP